MQVHVSWIESGTAVFSFRGTESTQDGLQDLKLIRRNIDFLARSCPGAKAHTGAHVGFTVMQGCSSPDVQCSGGPSGRSCMLSQLLFPVPGGSKQLPVYMILW